MIIPITPFPVQRSNLYSFIIKKLIAGDKAHLTPMEYDILGVLYTNNYIWKTSKLEDDLQTDPFSLNNYKKRLIKKGVLIKEGADFKTHPFLRLNLEGESIKLEFNITVQEDARESQHKTSEELLQEKEFRLRDNYLHY